MSLYRLPVVERAADPVRGIPGKVKFLNLAAIRELLDEWAVEEYETQRRRDAINRVALPEPAVDLEMQARVGASIRALAKQIGTS